MNEIMNENLMAFAVKDLADAIRLLAHCMQTGGMSLAREVPWLTEDKDIQSQISKYLKVQNLMLSARPENALLQADIDTIDKLLKCTEDELSRIRNMGATSLKEIKDALSARGLRLATNKS